MLGDWKVYPILIEQCKKRPTCLLSTCRGWNTNQLCGDCNNYCDFSMTERIIGNFYGESLLAVFKNAWLFVLFCSWLYLLPSVLIVIACRALSESPFTNHAVWHRHVANCFFCWSETWIQCQFFLTGDAAFGRLEHFGRIFRTSIYVVFCGVFFLQNFKVHEGTPPPPTLPTAIKEALYQVDLENVSLCQKWPTVQNWQKGW